MELRDGLFITAQVRSEARGARVASPRLLGQWWSLMILHCVHTQELLLSWFLSLGSFQIVFFFGLPGPIQPEI